MKIRTGFVSNSSSSSFILPFDSVDGVVTISFSIKDLQDMIAANSDESRIDATCSTIEEVQAHLLNEHGGRDDTFETMLEEEGEWVETKYKQMLEFINNGKSIMVGSLDNNEQMATRLIEKFGGSVEY
jgi:hypothetical protein